LDAGIAAGTYPLKGWTYSQTRLPTNVCESGQFTSFNLAPL
jgi:hypothetical protein